MQLRRRPGVPVADGDDGAAEVHSVHGPGDAGVGGAVGVGPVPEEAALVGRHGVGGAEGWGYMRTRGLREKIVRKRGSEMVFPTLL